MVPLIRLVNDRTMGDQEDIIRRIAEKRVVQCKAIPAFTGNNLKPDSVRLIAFSKADEGKTFYMDVTVPNQLQSNGQPMPIIIHIRRGW